MGIEHVYDSRSIEFAEQIRRDTDGYGVDIVLNSLTGAAQRAGIELLAIGGRFVEIGKRDIYGDTRLGLFPFRRNLAFYDVDLALLSISQPANGPRAAEHGVPARPPMASCRCPQSTHYPLAEAATAIRVMSAAEHTGKLVLDIPHAGRSSVVLPPEQAPVFRRDGAYIITGGLGWPWAVPRREDGQRRAAGRIVLTSRSQPNPEGAGDNRAASARSAPTSWWSAATSPSASTAERLVAAATATGLPLRGVLHAAAVVEDATLPNITDELIDRDWAPKVYGAWHLHRGHRRPAAGLVLLVLLGSRPGGLAWSGRIRRGQQLAGRLHPVAPGSGPAGHRDRMGRMGRDRRAPRRWQKAAAPR